ncbi:hypothetical protein RDI58_025109 [Solanum bulbocastanum]|uniref:Nudix hydrolase domain-containing protein n=1 Tax=Solanum bulbocastanum TaxID=147425 RepID=A0AAN8Y4A1_SOLBU
MQPTVQGTQINDLKFLLISSQKSPKWMFPKGGWATDEALEYVALRTFDVEVTREARELSDELGVKVFMADIISLI